MAGMARRDAADTQAGVIARLAVSGVERRAPLDANALAAALFVREWIRYARELPETIANIGALCRIPVGDCDDMVTVLAALLFRLGYAWTHQRFAIGWRDGEAVHVWLEVRGQRGWIPLDPSTWKIEPGQSPATWFRRVTHHRLSELT